MILKTLFVISISTAKIVFPDIPILPETQGAPPSEIMTASKSVSMSLTSSKYTDAIPSVRVDVPEGLGVGEFVKLIVRNPKPDTSDPKTAASQNKIVSKTYWGTGEQIPWGQPKREEVAVGAEGARLSYAHWPIGYNKEKVAGPTSKPAGKYTLTSNYCGGTSVAVDADQVYLEPINLLGLKGKIDPAKPVVVKWTRVPGAVGYVVNAFGGNQKETIAWTSGSDPAIALEIENTPITKENVESYIQKKIMMPPDTTVCTIPADVFKGTNNAVVIVTAVGADKVHPGDDMDTYVLVRSVASVPLNIVTPAPVPALPPSQ